MARMIPLIKCVHVFLRLGFLLALVAGLSACSLLSRFGKQNEDKLPGTRETVEIQASLIDQQRSRIPVQIAPVQNPKTWPQVSASPNNLTPHLSIGAGFSKRWTQSIGRGNTRNSTLLAEPLLVGSVLFTMDGRYRVSALSKATGGIVWQRDLRSTREVDGYFGGGLAYDKGVLIVTTGYGSLMALSAKSGNIVWRKNLSTPIRSAATVAGGRVFVQTVDSKITAFALRNGRGLWQHEGEKEQTGIIGSASPAVSGDRLVGVFPSGEIFALAVDTGKVIWDDSMSPLVGGGLLSELRDIKANPVINRGQVTVVSNAGRTANFDLARGSQIWETPVGGSQTPVVSGNQIFLVGNGAKLTALNRDTGQVTWQKQLRPSIEKSLSPDIPLAWFGPVLVGNRLMVVSAEGDFLVVDPRNGRTRSGGDLGQGAALAPTGGDGHLFFTTVKGNLMAYR